MHISFKKLGFTLLASTLASSALAGGFTPASCTPGSVTVPCEKTAWDVGFTGMYIKATNNDLHDYKLPGALGGGAGTINYFNMHVLNMDMDFAFKLQGGYHWGNGNDVNVNWTHFSTSSDSAVTDPQGAAGNTGRFMGNQLTVNSYVKLQHDAVNLEFGQLIHLGERIAMRFHAGGQWARIDGDFNQFGFNVASSINSLNNSKFDGLGPRFGIDGTYQLGGGLKAVGRSAIALLVGDLETHNRREVTLFGPGTVTTTIVNQKERTIVPSIDADLGLGYDHVMAQGNLGLEVGYHVTTIPHSVRWVDSANAVGYLTVTGNEVSNFGYHGPYATIKWTGNLA